MNSKEQYRVEVFCGGRRVRDLYYATAFTAYYRAVCHLFYYLDDYVQVSKDSKLLARMVRPT